MASFAPAWNRAVQRIGGGLMSFLFGDDCQVQSKYMTASKALSYAPVWGCVSKITGAFEVMPLNIHRDQGKSKFSVQKQHSSYNLMRWRPNAYQTPAVFKKQMMCHALLWGNARAYIHRDERGVPIELIPIMPDRTITVLISGRKWHATQPDPDERINLFTTASENPSSLTWIPDSEVWHIPGLGFDGVEGLSLITLARQSWGIGIDAESSVAKQMKKGYAGGLMLKAPVGAFRSEKDAKEFLDGFRKSHEGSDNAGTIGMLREGIEAQVMAMSSADAQFVEQRQFQREEAALWFVLQSILGDKSNSYASLEQKNLAYRTECLSPWTIKIEEESDLKLLSDSERRRGYYHKFNDGALLRTEKAQTMAYISQGISARVLSPNEGRDMLDMNPYEGGDTYENPNTISRGSQQDGSEEPAGDEPAKDDGGAAKRSRISHMVGVEAKRVINAAIEAVERDLNFIDWLDKYYGDRWLGKLSEVFAEIGIDASKAEEHCKASKKLLLDVCDYSQTDSLVGNVKKCVLHWETERIDYV